MYSCEQLTFTLYIKKVLFEKRLRQKGVSYDSLHVKTSVNKNYLRNLKKENLQLQVTSIFSCKFTLKMIASSYFIHKI